MKYWQLDVISTNTHSESFDMRTCSPFFVGDDSRNQLCIETTAVPSRLPLLRRKGDKLELQLTDEVAASLKGKFTKKKTWNSKLYRGDIYLVEGAAQWTIGNYRFFATQKVAPGLSKFAGIRDKIALKHFWQSWGLSLGSHAAVVLLFLIFSVVMNYTNQKQDELAEAKKITIAQVDEIFAPKVPAPQPPKTEPSLDQPPPKPSKKVANDASSQKALAAGQNTNKKPADARPKGLLAFNGSTNLTPKASTLRVAPVAQLSHQGKTALSAASNGLESFGKAQITTQSGKIASLSGVSGEGTYQAGQLGKGIQAGTSPSIQLVKKEIEIKGGLDPAVIKQIIEERLVEVRYCYESVLLSKSEISGKLATSWTIQADGSVANIQSNSKEILERDLHNCVQDRIKAWKFPQPKGGGVVHVKYPFVFRSLGS